MAAAQDVFSAIPPELQRLTCTFLSKADLKATRLVNKAWSTVAATVLWSQMEIDLDDIDQRKFDALLNSNVGGILDNVKELIISTDSDDLSQKSKQRATMNLLGLMAALPHNCLTVFRIKRFKLDAEVLALILCTQSQLTRLQMWLCAKTPGRLPNTNFARGNLSNLHSLCIHIDGSRNETYEGFGAWVLHAHKLRDLEIVGESSPTTSQFNGWTLPTHALPITLHRLVLKRLQFSDMAENLVTTLQLFDLRTLIIRFCKNIGPLLRSLATRFKQTDTISLRKLYILNFVLPEDTCRDLEYLVESVQGVTDLALGATHEGGLSRLRCLGSTGKTLQTLELHAGSQEKTYSAREIKQLTTYCPDLKILALSIGDLNPTINSMEVLDPLRICTLNHYVETLATLAKIPKLRGLVLMDQPLLENSYTSGERAWRYGQIADEIMACLVSKGSKIQQLWFIPSKLPTTIHHEDGHGHRWPYYSYEKGTVYTGPDSAQRVKSIVAVPTRGFLPKF